MNRLQQFHAFVGCLVAPIAILLVISGAWQAFRFHKATKDGSYKPWSFLTTVSNIHTNDFFRVSRSNVDNCNQLVDPAEAQRCRDEANRSASTLKTRSKLLGGMLVACGVLMFANVVSGMYMGIRLKKFRFGAFVCILLGLAAPLAILLL